MYVLICTKHTHLHSNLYYSNIYLILKIFTLILSWHKNSGPIRRSGTLVLHLYFHANFSKAFYSDSEKHWGVTDSLLPYKGLKISSLRMFLKM